MKLSNGQYTKFKNALDAASRVDPEFQWRFLNEELSSRDIETFLNWARDQLAANPQPHAASTYG